MSFNLSKEIVNLVKHTRLIAFDFDGVFTDNTVYVSEDGSETVHCHRGDGFGLRKLEQLGIRHVIVSSETNPVVSIRAKKMKTSCVQGVEDKYEALCQIADETSVSLNHMAFVGNDINDLPALKKVLFPIIVADSHDDVIGHEIYRTQAPGGRGAVREICDLFEHVIENLSQSLDLPADHPYQCRGSEDNG